MATLRNHTDADMFCAALHVVVPAHGSVEIDDDDADKVTVATGVFSVSVPERVLARRGSAVAEVSKAPAMETR